MKQFIWILLICVFFLSCERMPTLEDVSRYPHYSILILEPTSFTGLENDLDSGAYAFRINSKVSSADEYFDKIETQAKSEDWSLVSRAAKRLELERPQKEYPAATGYYDAVISFLGDGAYEISIKRRYSSRRDRDKDCGGNCGRPR